MIDRDKRWNGGEERWARPDLVFSPAGYAVDVIEDDAPAKQFVCEHHYAASYPSARFRVGLYGPGPALVAVAVFSHPMRNVVLTNWTGAGADDAVELGRFVCHDSVRFNGESWFLARAFKLLRMEKRITRVVSFADPMERRDAAGLVTKRAHWGTIYQASNALYAGRARARPLLMSGSGHVLSERTLAKMRAYARWEETQDPADLWKARGWKYSFEQFAQLGAPARRRGEACDAWIDRALVEGGFGKVKHPGNLAYVFGLTDEAKRSLAALHAGGLPYEKAA